MYSHTLLKKIKYGICNITKILPVKMVTINHTTIFLPVFIVYKMCAGAWMKCCPTSQCGTVYLGEKQRVISTDCSPSCAGGLCNRAGHEATNEMMRFHSKLLFAPSPGCVLCRVINCKPYSVTNNKKNPKLFSVLAMFKQWHQHWETSL